MVRGWALVETDWPRAKNRCNEFYQRIEDLKTKLKECSRIMGKGRIRNKINKASSMLEEEDFKVPPNITIPFAFAEEIIDPAAARARKNLTSKLRKLETSFKSFNGDLTPPQHRCLDEVLDLISRAIDQVPVKIIYGRTT